MHHKQNFDYEENYLYEQETDICTQSEEYRKQVNYFYEMNELILKKEFFWNIREGRYQVFDSKQKLINELRIFIGQIRQKMVQQDQSLFGMLKFDQRSFYYQLYQNCILLLKNNKCDNLLDQNIVKTGLLMLNHHKYLTSMRHMRLIKTFSY